MSLPGAGRMFFTGMRVKFGDGSRFQNVGILPDVPTIAESGYPGFEASVWYGFVAPAATPKEIVARLDAELARTIGAPELRERFAALGVEPHGRSAAVLPSPSSTMIGSRISM